MGNEQAIAGLIGSRICHDLISPLGAIGNGVELLQLSGQPQSPEMALIAASVAAANARIRLFRLAFGQASADGVAVTAGEIRGIAAAMGTGGRVHYEWLVEGEVPRIEAKALMLALLCLETALPLGGRVSVARNRAAWCLAASGARLRIDAPLWQDFGKHPVDTLTPAHIQFALLPATLGELGRRAVIESGDGLLTLSF